jgi:hypothetical protein
MTTFLEAPGTPVPIETTTFIRYPNAFRIDAKTPAGKLVQVFDGGEYWIQDAKGVTTAPDTVAEQIRGTVQRDVIGLLLALADGKVRAQRLPDVTADVMNEHRGLHAMAVSGGGMPTVTLLLDPASGLVRAQRYEALSGGGAKSAMEESFSDYRSIDGLQVAFSAAVKKDGVPFVTRRVLRFEYNIPLDAQLFVKPS